MRITSRRALLATGAAVAAVAAGGAVSIASASSGSTPSTTGGNAGTLRVTVTRPDGQTRTRPARSVRCTVAGGDYVLRAGRALAGRRAAATLTVPGYHGAGSYTGSLHVIVRTLFMRFDRTVSLPVTLTDTGGSVTVSRTLPGTFHPQLKGKTVSATAVWTCTP